MPKMKTHRGSAKRFTRTASGKLKRRQAGKNHMLSSKSTKLKRQLRRSDDISKADVSRVERLLPYL